MSARHISELITSPEHRMIPYLAPIPYVTLTASRVNASISPVQASAAVPHHSRMRDAQASEHAHQPSHFAALAADARFLAASLVAASFFLRRNSTRTRARASSASCLAANTLSTLASYCSNE